MSDAKDTLPKQGTIAFSHTHFGVSREICTRESGHNTLQQYIRLLLTFKKDGTKTPGSEKQSLTVFHREGLSMDNAEIKGKSASLAPDPDTWAGESTLKRISLSRWPPAAECEQLESAAGWLQEPYVCFLKGQSSKSRGNRSKKLLLLRKC